MRIPALAGLSLVVGVSLWAALAPAFGEEVPRASAPLPPPLPAPAKPSHPEKRASRPAAPHPPLPREKPPLASAKPDVPLPQEKPLLRLPAKPIDARKTARPYRKRPFPAPSFAPAPGRFGSLRSYPPSPPPPYPYRALPFAPERPFFAGPPYPYPPFAPPYAR